MPECSCLPHFYQGLVDRLEPTTDYCPLETSSHILQTCLSGAAMYYIRYERNDEITLCPKSAGPKHLSLASYPLGQHYHNSCQKKRHSVPTVTWMDKSTLNDRQTGEVGYFASGFMQSRSYSICYTALLHEESFCLHAESYPLPHQSSCSLVLLCADGQHDFWLSLKHSYEQNDNR